MSAPMDVATIAFQGATVGVSVELAIRCLTHKRDKAVSVRIGKIIMALTMAIKSILFISFHSSLGSNCYVIGRLADFFYHVSMTAGNYVLLCRVQSIVPIEWRKRALYFHSSITVLRLMIGIVDTVIVKISYLEDQTCLYVDEDFWGPVYTLYDTVVDLYVTIMISFILISHIRSLVADRMKANINLYTSVIYHNVIRTVLLTIVNLLSAILIMMKNQVDVIMLLWPIINISFIILVGYDSDVTKAIRRLNQQCWRSLSHMTSTVNLGSIPPIVTSTTPNVNNRRPTLKKLKRPTCELYPEMSMFDDTEVICSRRNSGVNECNECNDSYDLSLINMEQWKSRVSSKTERRLHDQADYSDMEGDEQDTRRHSSPASLQHHPKPGASYDTDNTLN